MIKQVVNNSDINPTENAIVIPAPFPIISVSEYICVYIFVEEKS
jgi:hypothetical protein